jgi:hypothetical protein
MVQKRIGHYFNDQQITTPLDLDKLHIAHRARRLTGSGPKGTEITLTQQRLRGRMHRQLVKFTTVPGDLFQ